MFGLSYVFAALVELFYIAVLIVLFYFAFKNRHSIKKAIPFSVLFIALAGMGIYSYKRSIDADKESAKAFLGYYKMISLDGKRCENGKLNLKNGFQYDIIVNDSIIGHGHWEVEHDLEEGGVYIHIDYGPRCMIFPTDREVYVDRLGDK